ncbi:MAG TPA: tRNA (5-methylaminomethyl-2-thiouridine)(34)-methyltransferase MnmD [Caulobacteraceae bacterium]
MTERAILDWSQDGAPRSRRFDDVYFSAEGGLDEARAVYLAGCGLPDAWRGRSRFTVGELGFGTGLNILALLELWRRTRPVGGRLVIFSIEAFPLSREDAAAALRAWPELEDLAAPLIRRWPTAEGFHRIDFPGLDASLDLAVMEAAEALHAWDGRADAWFLDGFSPAKNPEMWREAVLTLLAQRSVPGARAASFTIAGAVRRGLQAAGFSVERRPGFGRKAERLEARLGEAAPQTDYPAPRVCIIGAGIAGAALARAVKAQGLRPLVISGAGVAASGNPAALVTPRFDAGGGVMARLHAQAFARAVTLYEDEIPESLIARGVLQLQAGPRDGRRFGVVAESPLFEPDGLELLSTAAAGERLGEPGEAGGLWIEEGLVIEPASVLGAWLADCPRLEAEATSLRRTADGWAVIGADGEILAEADVVFIAGGFGSRRLWPELPLQAVRGQASFAAVHERPQAAAWGGYVIPTREGLLFGATHDRDREDVEVLEEDHRRNLQTLAKARPELAASLQGRPLAGRAALRASTPDHAPVAAALEPGLFALSGLGGRGFTLAPLLAEHIVSEALGASSPLPLQLAAAVGRSRPGARSAHTPD